MFLSKQMYYSRFRYMCHEPLTGIKTICRSSGEQRHFVIGKKKFGSGSKYADEHYHIESYPVACGQCLDCRIKKSREWALRCVHEAQLHKDNMFLTLTYAPQHLKSPSLVKKDYQDFLKRYRYYYGAIRYYLCGEYGPKLSRPHWHLLVFGHRFNDLVLRSPGATPLYRSSSLEELWPFGFSTIGDVTYQSAAYCARYMTKKIRGKAAKRYYKGLLPEFSAMSTHPGLGREWYEQYKSDCFPSDYLIHETKKMAIPRYYDRIFECENPEEYATIKQRRVEKAAKHASNNTEERLQARKVVLERRFKKLIRSYEAEE